MNVQIGTFEETFGENRGNDAAFFLNSDDEHAIKEVFLSFKIYVLNRE